MTDRTVTVQFPDGPREVRVVGMERGGDDDVFGGRGGDRRSGMLKPILERVAGFEIEETVGGGYYARAARQERRETYDGLEGDDFPRRRDD